MTGRTPGMAAAIALLLLLRPAVGWSWPIDAPVESAARPDSSATIGGEGPSDGAVDSTREEGGAATSVGGLAPSPLDRGGALLFGEALAGMPGIEVIDRGYLGSQTEAWFEGLPADHWMTLFDGVPMTDPNREALDLDMIPATAIERIEVERSPLLLEYGTRAAGGVLRIVPRQNAPGPARSRIRLTTGSFGTGSFRGGFRREAKGGRRGIWLGLGRVSTRGYREVDDLSLFQVHFGTRASFGRALGILFSAAGASSDRTAAGRIDRATSVARTRSDRHQLRLAASIFPEGPVPLEATAFFATARRDSLDVDSGDRIERRDGDRAEIRLRGRCRPAAGLSLTTSAGEEFLTGEDGARIHAFHFYSGGVWTPGGGARVEAGGRWEREGGRYSAWSGAVRLRQEIAKGLSLFASGSSVRHRPPLAERSETAPLEHDERVEAGLTLAGGRITHELAGFGRRLRDGRPPGEGPAPFSNLDVRGWRTSARVEIVPGFSVTAGYQWMSARPGAGSAPAGFVPRHLLKGGIEIERALAGDVLAIEAQLSGRYVRGREAPAASGDPEYGAADLHVGLRFVDVVFFATFRNLLDDRPTVAAGFPVAGHTARFGFSWDFID